MASTSEPQSRDQWSAAEKAKIVRRHIRDGIAVAILADEHGTAPSQIHAWIRTVLDDADQVLSDKRERNDRSSEKAIAAKDQRIRHLEAVAAELSMEVRQL